MGHVVVNRFGRQSLTVKGLMWLMWQHIHRKSHSARPYSASAAREEEVWLLENIKNLMTWKTKSFFWTLTGCITEGFTVKALINDHRDFKIRRGYRSDYYCGRTAGGKRFLHTDLISEESQQQLAALNLSLHVSPCVGADSSESDSGLKVLQVRQKCFRSDQVRLVYDDVFFIICLTIFLNSIF